MNVKEVLICAAKLLEKPATVAYLNNESLDEEGKKEAAKLLDCYNLVCSELSEEYLPLVKKERLYAQDGIYRYSEFSKSPLEIKNVYYGGKKVGFKIHSEYLFTPYPEVEIEYIFRSSTAVDIFETSDYDKSLITVRVLALGVVAEYALISGLYNEATVWRERFKEALDGVLFKRKPQKIPARSWF